MTMVLEGGEGSASRRSRSLPPRKTRYPLYKRLGGPQSQSGQVQKILPPSGFDPRTVLSVASRYTNCATQPTRYTMQDNKLVLLFQRNQNKLITLLHVITQKTVVRLKL